MLAKHPQAGPPSIPSDPAHPPLQVTEMDVVRALRSFPNGTGPGPSSFRANHLKEAVFCSSPDHANFALQGLLGVVNRLYAGRAPSAVIPHLCGASLFACKKRGDGIRPIAVGEVLHRLTSKCVSRAVQADAVRLLSPLQVGVGIPVGCEAIQDCSLCFQWTLISHLMTAAFCLLTFNSVNREYMFRDRGEGPHSFHGLLVGMLLWVSAPPPPGESYYSQLLWCAARRPLVASGFCPGPSSHYRKGQKVSAWPSDQHLVS